MGGGPHGDRPARGSGSAVASSAINETNTPPIITPMVGGSAFTEVWMMTETVRKLPAGIEIDVQNEKLLARIEECLAHPLGARVSNPD